MISGFLREEAEIRALQSYYAESGGRLRFKCVGARAETRFRLSAKRTSPFKLAGASVQSTTGSRGVRISGSYAGYTMFRGSAKGTGYPLHSAVSTSLPLPCVNRVPSRFNWSLITRLSSNPEERISLHILDSKPENRT